MSKIVILKADNSFEVKDYPSDLLEQSLAVLQSAVEGYVEFIHLDRIRMIMVVNGEGKVNNLPLNPVASHFFWREYGLEGVYGDVAFVSNITNEVGDPDGLSERQVKQIEEDIRWRIEEIEQSGFDRRLDLNEYATLKGE